MDFLELETSAPPFFADEGSTGVDFLLEETLTEEVAFFFCKRVVCFQLMEAWEAWEAQLAIFFLAGLTSSSDSKSLSVGGSGSLSSLVYEDECIRDVKNKGDDARI